MEETGKPDKNTLDELVSKIIRIFTVTIKTTARHDGSRIQPNKAVDSGERPGYLSTFYMKNNSENSTS